MQCGELPGVKQREFTVSQSMNPADHAISDKTNANRIHQNPPQGHNKLGVIRYGVITPLM
jgi:hypothetical protein